MSEKIEGLVKAVYKSWKKRLPKAQGMHLDEESFACFLEGRLSAEEKERINTHLISCDDCLEIFSLSINAQDANMQEVPGELLDKVRVIISLKEKMTVLEVILRLKENMLEVINSNGDILVGRELVSAPALRSRNIRDFKDEVTVLKDFKDVRVEVRLENKGGKYFNLMLQVKKKHRQGLLKDLRVTLIKDDLELESCISDTGSVNFEHILLGKYSLEVTCATERVALVMLDVKA